MLNEAQRDRVIAISEGQDASGLETIQSFTEMHSRPNRASEFNVELSITLLELAFKCKAAGKDRMYSLLCFMASCAMDRTDRHVAAKLFTHYIQSKINAMVAIKAMAALLESQQDAPPSVEGDTQQE